LALKRGFRTIAKRECKNLMKSSTIRTLLTSFTMGNLLKGMGRAGVQNSTKRLKVSHRIPDEKREHVPNKLSCPFHRVVRDFVIEALQETLEKPMDRRWYPHSQGEEPAGNQGCGRYW
jgi:hypothetical protein